MTTAELPTPTEDTPVFLPVARMPESFVCGLFGPRGSGKSAAAAYYAWVWSEQKDKKRKVFYFPETFGYFNGKPLSFEDLVLLSVNDTDGEQILPQLNGAVVILDEMQQIFSKYRTSSMANRSIGAFLQQIRKRGCVLIFTSNSPDQIDYSLTNQTDAHAFCAYFEDPVCRSYSHHVVGCRDWIKLDWVDTNGKTGRDFRFWDGRRRTQRFIQNAIALSQWYNTFASVSAQEVASMDAEKVMAAYDRAKGSKGAMTAEAVKALKEQIIPWLVMDRGASEVMVGQLAEWLKDQDIEGCPQGINTSAVALGRAFTELGLQKKRGSAGTRYLLPEAGDLGDWLAGFV